MECIRILLDSNAIIDFDVLSVCDESYVTEDAKKKVSNTLIKRVKNINKKRLNLDIDFRL